MKARRPSSVITMLISLSLFFSSLPRALAQAGGQISLESLAAGQAVNGFRAEALYLSDTDKAIGGRFRHERTGFTLDLLQIQSVPQAFMWVNSFPTSDMGEPHTQEHLLLGKGNKGRSVASLEDMSLAGSSAFTMQWRTIYHFHTAAGPEIFYTLFERQVDALLHPDYTDEEIRREVRNLGVTENPADKSLRLEEKGTVYNEMVRYYENATALLFRALNMNMLGKNHPLALSAGGFPAAIREMKPEDIKKFHSDNYRLGNMGMVASFPKEMAVGDILKRLDTILNRLEPNAEKRAFKAVADLPAPQAAAAGKIQIVEYPFKNDQQPGLMVFSWPAPEKRDIQEITLLQLFLSNLAGDATTNLYKKFVDTKTREMDLGAKGVFNYVDEELDYTAYIGLSDVTVANMTEEKIAQVRQKILDEIARIASFEDGSPELAEFNTRLKNRVIETRRQLSKFVNSPPGFGFRNSNSGWMTHLDLLNRTKDFRKSVTMKSEMAFIEQLLAGQKNFWRDYITKWKLNETPYAAAARPNPEIIKQEERERQARVETELARLKTRYNVTEAQEAIKRYRAEYDATTAEMEKLEKQAAATRFIENPPLTLDDQLDFKVTKLTGDVPLVASTFDNMTSATTGLALRLDSTPENELVYLSMLPTLLTQVGVIKDGKSISYEEMSELLRKEILSLNAYFSTNLRTDRAELALRGAGNDATESARAVEWMKLVLFNPDWRPENLPRIRDVVDQTLSGLRSRMQGAEENWVNDPANAYWRQDNPLLLTTSSFLTRAHNVHRLRWMLKDAGTGEAREAITNFLNRLAGAGAQGKREELKALLGAMQGNKEMEGKVTAALKPYWDAFAALPEGARSLALEAAKDLDLILADVPDSSLASDWSYLANQIRQDLLTPPAKALADLNSVRQRLLKTGNARMFVIGSRASQQKLESGINTLLAGMEKAPATPARYQSAKLIDARLRGRVGATATAPVFVGLLNPNTQGGVFLNTAPVATYLDTDRDKLLDFLAARLYGGGGAHSIFMKTWGAGLAYSNGLRAAPSSGRLIYYAERVPELPQTLRFVINELKRAPLDEALAEYAVAQVFGEFRSASPYEARGEAMANDLADGLTPETISRFRRAILELRREPKLMDELHKRMGQVYAKVLPGYGVKAKDVEGGVFFVIGPEKQLVLYEDYLKTIEGADTRVHRLYPRDFWMTAK